MDWIVKLSSEPEAKTERKIISRCTGMDAPKPPKPCNQVNTASVDKNRLSPEDLGEAATTYNPKPYITNGELRIPINCHPKYKWWKSGQEIHETLAELEAPQSVWLSHVDPARHKPVG